jgi:hypothetical protein
MTRTLAALVLVFSAVAVAATGVKIAGVEFVPKDLIFAAPETKSRATAEGELPDECKWQFNSETRLGRREEPQGCIRFYFKTTVTLTSTCPAPSEKTATRSAERITATEVRCPDASGKIKEPPLETRALSSGTTVEGRKQDVVLQPDGTRITLLYDSSSVTASVAWPDGSGDALQLPVK